MMDGGPYICYVGRWLDFDPLSAINIPTSLHMDPNFSGLFEMDGNKLICLLSGIDPLSCMVYNISLC